MQYHSSRKHNIVLKSSARVDVVIRLCRVEISYFGPETDREQHLNWGPDVDTTTKLQRTPARSPRRVLRSVNSVGALIEQRVASTR